MPTDLLAQQGMQVSQPRDLLAGQPNQQISPEAVSTSPVDGTTMLDALRNILGIGKTELQIPMVAAQNLQKFGLEIPGVKKGIAALANLIPGVSGVTAQDVQPTPVVTQPTTAAKIGGGLVSGLLGEELAAPVLGGVGLPSLLSKLGASAFGGMTAAPEQKGIASLLGILSRGGIEVAPKVAKAIPKMDVVLRSRLGQRLIDAFGREKEISNNLYNQAFSGTENITPQLGKDTIENFNELKASFPGKRGGVPRALAAYNKEPTLQNLHFLRSDLGKEWNALEIKRESPTGLTKAQAEDQELLSETRANISKSLDNNFKAISPNKTQQYNIAQRHFEDRIAPFSEKGHTGIMKALSTDRNFTNKMFNELSADSVKASKVRNVVGLSRPHLELAKILRSKLVTIPAIGAGLFFGGRRLF